MTARPLRIALVVGEASGDHLGAALMKEIRSRRPDTVFFGVAGERMTDAGVESPFPLGDVAVMGFGAVVARLPRIIRRIRETTAHIVAERPDVLVIIDSPGFTQSVAKRVARQLPDLPIVNYVSPSVWAWRKGRARKMARYIDHVMALLPFEPEAHRLLGGPPCTYVGHPLIENREKLRPAPGERAGVDEEPHVLILPGSRLSEVKRLMEPFGATAGLIARSKPNVRFVLPAVTHLRPELERRVADWPVQVELVVGEEAKLAAFRQASAALAASGTVTLELALAKVPMIVAYRVEWLARSLKWLLKVHSIVLANLVLGDNTVPEFLDDAGSPEVLAGEILALLEEGPAREAQLSGFARLDALMETPDGQTPSERAADIVLDYAQKGKAASGRPSSIPR
ncbi:lipid-A-disaccharide synthase [Rhodopseudomonas julia]|uniref:Lipid-A-disaccharide synthase n=1 Tax=Rhodopseudomonas julia TaxID=200617 RepID=A0ABU0C9Z2_9BRAD|nr:lipid-A-disaccharide synthase [Rhodopseudomonas julia]MDQ0327304.1 lipid-A-disaccharide synthase [Rhodopseudomonas julia]